MADQKDAQKGAQDTGKQAGRQDADAGKSRQGNPPAGERGTGQSGPGSTSGGGNR